METDDSRKRAGTEKETPVSDSTDSERMQEYQAEHAPLGREKKNEPRYLKLIREYLEHE